MERLGGGQSPLVSVVIPSFQSARDIEEAVSSALSQTWPNGEVCVSDHGSTDATWEVLQRFSGHPDVRLQRIGPGGGAARNWDAATAMARGEYVKLLPADDVIHPSALEEQVKALEAHPTAGLVACRRNVVDTHGRLLVAERGLGGLLGLTPGREAIRRIVRSGTNPLGEPGCVLFRRQALIDAGGWATRHPYMIDVDAYVRVLTHHDFVGLPAALADFRVSSTQWSVRLAREQSQQAREWQRSVAEALPQLVARRDLRLGAVRARGLALSRRAAYAWWGWRAEKE